MRKDNVDAPILFHGIRNAQKIIQMSQPAWLYKSIFSTGELDHIEQSMVVKAGRGLVFMIGCSHPKMQHILHAALKFGNVYAIIGGLHGFDDYKLFDHLILLFPMPCA